MATLVVGDVHGCARELGQLLDEAEADRVVFVGDLFTRGPDPVGVWELVRDRESVIGNHEDKLLRARAGEIGGRSVADALQRLERGAKGWRRWVQDLPIFLDVGRYLVVHAGLHPSGDRAATTRERALYLRRWPDERPESPRWWEVYTGTQPVLFGHDAARGHVRVDGPDGEPLLVGLDTGCVYGGRLSGWLIEEERLVSVKARRTYLRPRA